MSALPKVSSDDCDDSLAARIVALQRTNKKLDDFIHIASHDLRSPLRAMLSLFEWLREDLEKAFGALPEAIVSDLDEVTSQGKRMSSLLNDLMEFSRVGHFEEQLSLCNAKTVIEDSLLICAIPPKFTVKLSSEFPTLSCAAVEFAMVVRNLLSNAIKHHDLAEGKIEIDAWEHNGFGYFRFSDDGPGIAPENSSEIFEMFKTLDAKKGNGIGLGLVKKIATKYGGLAICEPNPKGRGCVFTTSFPLAINGVPPNPGNTTSAERRSISL